MRHTLVGVPYAVLAGIAAATLIACGESTDPGNAVTTPSLHATVASSLPIANATVHVISALDNSSGDIVPTGINDSDAVVAYQINIATDVFVSFRWDATHGLKRLPTPSDSIGARAFGINDVGAIVGTLDRGSFAGHDPVVWWNGGSSMRVLRLAADSASSSGRNDCWANGINKYSVIVGYCIANLDFLYPAVFPWHGPAQFPAPAGMAPFTSISDDGWMTGGSAWIDSRHHVWAYVRSPAGKSIALPTQGQGGHAYSYAVTQHGFAAGKDSLGGCFQAVAWLANGTQQFLPEVRLGTCGTASSLTADWYVVGQGVDAQGNNGYAFVWFPEKGLQRLPGLGGVGETSSAVWISGRHHAVGWIKSGGIQHTVIWDIGPR